LAVGPPDSRHLASCAESTIVAGRCSSKRIDETKHYNLDESELVNFSYDDTQKRNNASAGVTENFNINNLEPKLTVADRETNINVCENNFLSTISEKNVDSSFLETECVSSSIDQGFSGGPVSHPEISESLIAPASSLSGKLDPCLLPTRKISSDVSSSAARITSGKMIQGEKIKTQATPHSPAVLKLSSQNQPPKADANIKGIKASVPKQSPIPSVKPGFNRKISTDRLVGKVPLQMLEQQKKVSGVDDLGKGKMMSSNKSKQVEPGKKGPPGDVPSRNPKSNSRYISDLVLNILAEVPTPNSPARPCPSKLSGTRHALVASNASSIVSASVALPQATADVSNIETPVIKSTHSALQPSQNTAFSNVSRLFPSLPSTDQNDAKIRTPMLYTPIIIKPTIAVLHPVSPTSVQNLSRSPPASLHHLVTFKPITSSDVSRMVPGGDKRPSVAPSIEDAVHMMRNVAEVIRQNEAILKHNKAWTARLKDEYAEANEEMRMMKDKYRTSRSTADQVVGTTTANDKDNSLKYSSVKNNEQVLNDKVGSSTRDDIKMKRIEIPKHTMEYAKKNKSGVSKVKDITDVNRENERLEDLFILRNECDRLKHQYEVKCAENVRLLDLLANTKDEKVLDDSTMLRIQYEILAAEKIQLCLDFETDRARLIDELEPLRDLTTTDGKVVHQNDSASRAARDALNTRGALSEDTRDMMAVQVHTLSQQLMNVSKQFRDAQAENTAMRDELRLCNVKTSEFKRTENISTEFEQPGDISSEFKRTEEISTAAEYEIDRLVSGDVSTSVAFCANENSSHSGFGLVSSASSLPAEDVLVSDNSGKDNIKDVFSVGCRSTSKDSFDKNSISMQYCSTNVDQGSDELTQLGLPLLPSATVHPNQMSVYDKTYFIQVVQARNGNDTNNYEMFRDVVDLPNNDHVSRNNENMSENENELFRNDLHLSLMDEKVSKNKEDESNNDWDSARSDLELCYVTTSLTTSTSNVQSTNSLDFHEMLTMSNHELIIQYELLSEEKSKLCQKLESDELKTAELSQRIVESGHQIEDLNRELEAVRSQLECVDIQYALILDEKRKICQSVDYANIVINEKGEIINNLIQELKIFDSLKLEIHSASEASVLGLSNENHFTLCSRCEQHVKMEFIDAASDPIELDNDDEKKSNVSSYSCLKTESEIDCAREAPQSGDVEQNVPLKPPPSLATSGIEQVDGLESELNTEKRKNASLTLQQNQALSKIEELQRKMRELESDLEECWDGQGTLKEDKEKLRHELVGLQDSKDKLIRSLQEDVIRLKAVCEDYKLYRQAKEALVSDLQEEVLNRHEEVDGLHARLSSAKEDVKTLRTLLEDLLQSKERQEVANRKMDRELCALLEEKSKMIQIMRREGDGASVKSEKNLDRPQQVGNQLASKLHEDEYGAQGTEFGTNLEAVSQVEILLESSELINQQPHLSTDLLKIILERDQLAVEMSQLNLKNDILSVEYSELQQKISNAKRTAKLGVADIRGEVEKIAIELESTKMEVRRAEEEKASIFEQLFKAETEVQYLTIQLGVETNTCREKTAECCDLQARIMNLEEQKEESLRQMQVIQDNCQTELIQAASTIQTEIANVEGLRLDSEKVRLESEKEVALLSEECEAYRKELDSMAKSQLAVVEDTNNNIRSQLDLALAAAKNAEDRLEISELECLQLTKELDFANLKLKDVNIEMSNMNEVLSEGVMANTILSKILETSRLEKVSAVDDAAKAIFQLNECQNELRSIILKMEAVEAEKLDLIDEIGRQTSKQNIFDADWLIMLSEKESLSEKCDDLTVKMKDSEMARNQLATQLETITSANVFTDLSHSEEMQQLHVILEELKEENRCLNQMEEHKCKIMEHEQSEASLSLEYVQEQCSQLRVENERLVTQALHQVVLNSEESKVKAENMNLLKAEIDNLVSQNASLEEKYTLSTDEYSNSLAAKSSLEIAITEMRLKLDATLVECQSMKDGIQASKQECIRCVGESDGLDWKLRNTEKELNHLADMLSESLMSTDLEVALSENVLLTTENNLQKSEMAELKSKLTMLESEQIDMKKRCETLREIINENETAKNLLCQQLEEIQIDNLFNKERNREEKHRLDGVIIELENQKELLIQQQEDNLKIIQEERNNDVKEHVEQCSSMQDKITNLSIEKENIVSLIDEEKISSSTSMASLKAEIDELAVKNLNLQNQLEVAVSANFKQCEEMTNLKLSNSALHVEVASQLERLSSIAENLKHSKELETILSSDKLLIDNKLLDLRQAHGELLKEIETLVLDNENLKIQLEVSTSKENDLKRDNDLINVQYSAAVRHCDELESKYLDLCASVDELNRCSKIAHDDIIVLKSEIEHKSAGIEQLTQEINILEQQNEKYITDNQIVTDKFKDVIRQLVNAQEKSNDLANLVNTLESQSIADLAKINLLQNELTEGVKENDQAVQNSNKWLADIEFEKAEKLCAFEELVGECDRLKIRDENQQLEFQKLIERGTNLEELNSTYRTQLDDANRTNLLSETAYARSLEDLHHLLSESNAKVELERLAFEKAEHEIQKLRKDCETFENTQRLLVQEKSELNNHISGLVNDVIQLKSTISEFSLYLEESEKKCDQLVRDHKSSDENIMTLTEENEKQKQCIEQLECSLKDEKLMQMEIVQKLESMKELVGTLDDTQSQLKISENNYLILQAALDTAKEGMQKIQRLADDQQVALDERDKINFASVEIIHGCEEELSKKVSLLAELEKENKKYIDVMSDLELEIISFNDVISVNVDNMFDNPDGCLVNDDSGENMAAMCKENKDRKAKSIREKIKSMNKLILAKLSKLDLEHQTLSESLSQLEVRNETVSEKLRKETVKVECLREENLLTVSNLGELSDKLKIVTREKCQLEVEKTDAEQSVIELTTKLESLTVDKQDAELKHLSACNDLNKTIADQAVSISELNMVLQQLRSDLSVSEDCSHSRNDEIQKLQSELVKANVSLVENDLEKRRHEEMIKQQRSDLEDGVVKQKLLEENMLRVEEIALQVKQSYNIETDRLAAELSRTTDTATDLTRKHNALEASYSKMSEECQTSQINLLHLQEEIQEVMEVNNDLKLKLSQSEDYSRTLESESLDFRSENVMLQNEELKLKVQAETLNEQIKELTKQAEQLTLQNETSSKCQSELVIQLNEARLEFSRCQEALVGLETKLQFEKNQLSDQISDLKQVCDGQEQRLVFYDTQLQQLVSRFCHHDTDQEVLDNKTIHLSDACSDSTVSNLDRLTALIDSELRNMQEQRNSLSDSNRDKAKLSEANEALLTEIQCMREEAVIDAELELSIQELQEENAKLFQNKTQLENQLMAGEADRKELVMSREDNEYQLIREKESFEAKMSDLYKLLDAVSKAKENLESELIRQRNEFEKSLAAARSDSLTRLGKSEADKRRIIEQMSESDSQAAGLRDRLRTSAEEKELLALRLVALTRECQTHEAHAADLRAQIDTQRTQLQEATQDHKETIQLLIELKLEAELARREQRGDFNRLEEELVRLESQIGSNSGSCTPCAITFGNMLDSHSGTSLRASDSASRDQEVHSPNKFTGVDEDVYKVLEGKHFRLVDEMSDVKRDLREISDAKEMLLRENKSLRIMLDQLKHSAPHRVVPPMHALSISSSMSSSRASLNRPMSARDRTAFESLGTNEEGNDVTMIGADSRVASMASLFSGSMKSLVSLSAISIASTLDPQFTYDIPAVMIELQERVVELGRSNQKLQDDKEVLRDQLLRKQEEVLRQMEALLEKKRKKAPFGFGSSSKDSAIKATDIMSQQIVVLQEERDELLKKLEDHKSKDIRISELNGKVSELDESLRREKVSFREVSVQKEQLEIELLQKCLEVEKHVRNYHQLQEMLTKKDRIEQLQQKHRLEETNKSQQKKEQMFTCSNVQESASSLLLADDQLEGKGNKEQLSAIALHEPPLKQSPDAAGKISTPRQQHQRLDNQVILEEKRTSLIVEIRRRIACRDVCIQVGQTFVVSTTTRDMQKTPRKRQDFAVVVPVQRTVTLDCGCVTELGTMRLHAGCRYHQAVEKLRRELRQQDMAAERSLKTSRR